MTELPAPAEDAMAASRALRARIDAAIADAGGWLRFDRYMELALYEPGLGYYSGGAEKIGPGGDFTTAAELGTFLGDALAEFFAPLVATMSPPALLEIGAGSGRLAARVIERLVAAGCERLRYDILEPSATLRARQAERLAEFGDRVSWLDRLPATPRNTLVFGNEVADALPVVRFEIVAGDVRPLGVVNDAGRLTWRLGPEDAELTAAVRAIERDVGDLPAGYRSEVCLVLPGWIAALAAAFASGGLLLIDYGLPRRDYYRAERADGTLVCHYRHRVHADPFALPGLQDITAWVDFTACARAGRDAGLAVAGYTTQAQFLLAALASATPAPALDARAASALKTLVLPGEMGERFKLLWLTRGLGDVPLPGRDLRSWL